MKQDAMGQDVQDVPALNQADQAAFDAAMADVEPLNKD